MDGASTFVIAVFAAVYLSMALGRMPWLKLDRTGVALLGLIALLASDAPMTLACGMLLALGLAKPWRPGAPIACDPGLPL